MKTKTPMVSIVMPVYNPGSFLVAAIESILSQTYTDFELIVINDASTDGTGEILDKYAKLDKRIRVYTNTKNLGVTKSEMLGVAKSRGQFIGRMDSDDISYPERIGEQVAFLQKNKDVVAVGAQCDLIDSKGNIIGSKRFPTDDKSIRGMIFTSVPLQQPAMMVNTKLLPKDFVWYDENYASAEELELLFKFFQIGKVRNLSETLLKYRIHGSNTSLVNPKKTFSLTLKTRFRAISKYGYKPTLKGVIATLVQYVIVSVIPSKWIYPLYVLARGMGKPNATIINNEQVVFEESLQLVKT